MKSNPQNDIQDRKFCVYDYITQTYVYIEDQQQRFKFMLEQSYNIQAIATASLPKEAQEIQFKMYPYLREYMAKLPPIDKNEGQQ